MSYAPVYHAACRELVDFGASRPERANAARTLIARALKSVPKASRQRERYHLLFISGHFPDKVQS